MGNIPQTIQICHVTYRLFLVEAVQGALDGHLWSFVVAADALAHSSGWRESGVVFS